ncbi:hypothetical protein [Cochleicola gelatinilyticus]|uniref:Uncharacterized protein n=1 Tax=Cochleicola gelatinilyticus TaxID=1763537 RepID=A0A167HMA4_9FLAO|nr:hypothetical protein [Cochleicola gelatinilyticus]OAB78765.1 hypothetical protein ULVI_09290 [Cochleicola gelatinilyticus]
MEDQRKQFKKDLDFLLSKGYNAKGIMIINNEKIFRFDNQQEADEVTELGFNAYQTEKYLEVLNDHIDTLQTNEEGKFLKGQEPFFNSNLGKGYDSIKDTF